MKLGFIGFGEVGFEISRGLNKEGLSGIVAYDPLWIDQQCGKLMNQRAQEAGVILLDTPTAVAKQSDVIIGAVPGSEALKAAMDAIPPLDNGKIYFDVSTSSALTKKKIAEAVRAKRSFFVDGAMMGPVSVQKHKVPTLISGSGCDKLIPLLTRYHMSLEKVSDIPGDAISIKLVRSIYMKGVASLAVEMLEAAAKLKVETLVLKSISGTMNATPFVETLDWLIPATAIHARRQAHEMVDVTEMMKEIGVEPTMTEATTKRLQWLVGKNLKEKFREKKPCRWEDVVQAWTDN
jgi:3-hydroxyisobutyrate dehydrogenase-like beta-hydroxyacid dehydrogenase